MIKHFLPMIVSLLAGFLPPGSGTAKTFTLPDLIEQVEKQNLMVKAAGIERDISANKEKEALESFILPGFNMKTLAGPVPDIDGTVAEPITYRFFDFDEFVQHIGPFIRFEVDAIQPLYTFGKIDRVRALASLGTEHSKELVDKTRMEAALKTANLFFSLQLAYALDQIATDTNEKLNRARTRLTELIGSQEEQGTFDYDENDLRKLDYYLFEIKKEQIKIRGGLSSGFAALKVLIGSDREEEMDIAPKELTPLPHDQIQLDEYLRYAEEHRAEYREIALGLDANRLNEELARLKFYPDFFIGGKFRYNKAPGRLDIHEPFLKDEGNFKYLGFAFGLNFDLDYWLTYNKMVEARLKRQRDETKSRLARIALDLDIEKNFNTFQQHRLCNEITERKVALADGIFTSKFAEFQSGFSEIKIEDLADSFKMSAEAKIEQARQFYDYNVALFTLKASVGMRLP